MSERVVTIEKKTAATVSGSCHCGAVQYTFTGDIRTILNCHCGLCRKMNGAAFSSYVVVYEEGFELLRGELNRMQVTEDAAKTVCVQCATPIFNTNSRFDGLKVLYLGSVDIPAGLQPTLNIYSESQLPWIADVTALASLPTSVS